LANKKIWAYAINAEGKYVEGEKHPLRIYYIWEALRMGNQSNRLTFMSTQRDPLKRQKIIPVNLGFYRYMPGKKVMSEYEKDGSSLSHSIAIQVIAEMDTIPFIIGDRPIHLKVEDIRAEDLKIQLTNRNKFEYYYPDLICQFSEPRDLALKWGGKVAIEVKHWHACEREKCQDFEAHGIPIIEVNIENISMEKWYGKQNHSPELLEKYYVQLKRLFQEKVYGRILSDPVSNAYHRAALKDERNQSEKVIDELKKIKLICAQLIAMKERLEVERSNMAMRNTELHEKIRQLDTENAKIKERGLGFYLLKMIGFSR